ncbi:MAG: hypothetical protein ASARMPRED_005457 [Alectoria sarmentosa]|nr:MAG: hypothetical protein ASARMPRED_005457 [Alectoria sarmentosa]
MAGHLSKLVSFQLSRPQSDKDEPRVGRLTFQGRSPIDTPHYVAVSSRGAVPHLSQDMMRDSTSTRALYTAVEDFIEKSSHQSQVPPVFNFPAAPNESPLRKFIALQKDVLLILGTRRIPPLPCAASSTSSAISIITSLGFGMLEYTDYAEAIQKLRPDIVLGMGDVLFGHKPGVKRKEAMGDRTLAWLKELISAMENEKDGTPRTALFAPILPIETEQQTYYLDALQDELKDSVSGLVLYDSASVDAIPESLRGLPRLSLGDATSPHKLLDAMALGIDAFTVPFITDATDAGIALDFSFPAHSDTNLEKRLSLGIDMWSSTFVNDVSPLLTDCECYTCKNHHRAFVQHLLNAKEMLGWVLLQLHNHHIIDGFFAGARDSIHNGSFEGDRAMFKKTYAALPAKTGQGPRVRGYQFRSEGKGGPRKNPIAYRPLDDGNKELAKSALPSPDDDAKNLEQQGFAEKVQ